MFINICCVNQCSQQFWTLFGVTFKSVTPLHYPIFVSSAGRTLTWKKHFRNSNGLIKPLQVIYELITKSTYLIIPHYSMINNIMYAKRYGYCLPDLPTFEELLMINCLIQPSRLQPIPRVRTIPRKAPNTQYPLILASSDTNTQYQYRY